MADSRWLIADGLQACGRRARQKAVVEDFIGDPRARQVALGLFVTVEADLRGVGKARAELDEERAEVVIHANLIVLDGLLER